MFAKNLHHRLHGSLEEREEAQHKSWEDQLRSILAGVQERGATPTPRGAAVTQGGDAPGVLQVTCLLQDYGFIIILFIFFLGENIPLGGGAGWGCHTHPKGVQQSP